MKALFTTILLFSVYFCYSQHTITLKNNGSVTLLGPIEKDQLLSPPFSDWFTTNYDEYAPDKKVLKELKKALKQVDSITVFFGTWCGDSHREVPRFLKILDELNYSSYQLIGLDRNRLTYKRSPYGEEMGLNIHRVPTFIFYCDSTEIGRIVEFPRRTLEEDMSSIVNSEEYEPNYLIVEKIDQLMESKGAKFVNDHLDSLYQIYQPISIKIGELNTYAFKQLTLLNMGKAKAAYLLNVRLFPDDYYPVYSLGRFYIKIGEYDKGKEVFKIGLSKYPDNEELRKQLAFFDNSN